MYCLKDDILIRRIGNKMYIVIEKDYDNIYEFEEDSFNIIQIMVKLKKFEIKELIHNLKDEYIIYYFLYLLYEFFKVIISY